MRRIFPFVSLFLAAALLRAVCPTPTVNYAWQNGVGVNYTLSAPCSQPPAFTCLSIDSLGIGNDINAAFNQWTYANQAQNNTNVGFYYSTTGAYPNLCGPSQLSRCAR